MDVVQQEQKLLDCIKFNCQILLSQPISSQFLPLHSLGNIRIVYCGSDSIELGKSKQDVALCNYRSQGMMEEQTEAEVSSVFHRLDVHCLRLSSYSLFNLLPVLSLGLYSQAAHVSRCPPSCVAYCLVTIVSPHRGHAPRHCSSIDAAAVHYKSARANMRNTFCTQLHRCLCYYCYYYYQ